MSQVRLLYVPNEGPDPGQNAARRTFDGLLSEGALAGYSCVSLLRTIQQCGREDAFRALLAEVDAFGPTHVLVQHMGASGLGRQHIDRFRQAVVGAFMAYHEMDPYSRLRAPLPAPAGDFARSSDMVLTCGTGAFSRNFYRAGARQVMYSPHCYDPWRVSPPSATTVPDLDVVMIGNRNAPRKKPWRKFPGAHSREQLVKLLSRKFKTGFAVFGRGWKGPSARGPCRYDEQVQWITHARVSVNWDHFPKEPHYFSDRLPISLVAGVPHVTTLHPGYEDLFGGLPGLIGVTTVEDVVEAVSDLLKRPQDELQALGRGVAEFAVAHLRQDTEFSRILALMSGDQSTNAEWLPVKLRRPLPK